MSHRCCEPSRDHPAWGPRHSFCCLLPSQPGSSPVTPLNVRKLSHTGTAPSLRATHIQGLVNVEVHSPQALTSTETSVEAQSCFSVTSGIVWEPCCGSMRVSFSLCPPWFLHSAINHLHKVFNKSLLHGGPNYQREMEVVNLLTGTCFMMEKTLHIFLLLIKIGKKN